jgi:hypothetical protein
MLPNIANVWFPCKCAMDSRKDYFSYCICIRATRTSSMDGTIFSLEIDMAKKYVNQNFDKRWVVHNLNNMFKRWVIHNLLKTITFKVEG